MQVNESLWLSEYVKILKYNKKSDEDIKYLKKEFIDYVEGRRPDVLSDELTQYLKYLAFTSLQGDINELTEDKFHKGK